jgi:hypothetical protein
MWAKVCPIPKSTHVLLPMSIWRFKKINFCSSRLLFFSTKPRINEASGRGFICQVGMAEGPFLPILWFRQLVGEVEGFKHWLLSRWLPSQWVFTSTTEPSFCSECCYVLLSSQAVLDNRKTHFQQHLSARRAVPLATAWRPEWTHFKLNDLFSLHWSAHWAESPLSWPGTCLRARSSLYSLLFYFLFLHFVCVCVCVCVCSPKAKCKLCFSLHPSDLGQ